MVVVLCDVNLMLIHCMFWSIHSAKCPFFYSYFSSNHPGAKSLSLPQSWQRRPLPSLLSDSYSMEWGWWGTRPTGTTVCTRYLPRGSSMRVCPLLMMEAGNPLLEDRGNILLYNVHLLIHSSGITRKKYTWQPLVFYFCLCLWLSSILFVSVAASRLLFLVSVSTSLSSYVVCRGRLYFICVSVSTSCLYFCLCICL